jgi:hypothetical protein
MAMKCPGLDGELLCACQVIEHDRPNHFALTRGRETAMFVPMVEAGRIEKGQCPALYPVFLKPHGIVRGVFRVRPDLPNDMRVDAISLALVFDVPPFGVGAATAVHRVLVARQLLPINSSRK